jgi:hypothetical protein
MLTRLFVILCSPSVALTLAVIGVSAAAAIVLLFH